MALQSSVNPAERCVSNAVKPEPFSQPQVRYPAGKAGGLEAAQPVLILAPSIKRPSECHLQYLLRYLPLCDPYR